MQHYLNGNWVSQEDLKISALDISVLRGFGVFDFFRTYNQKAYRLGDNIDRFFKSCEIIGITVLWSKEDIEKLLLEGIEKNKQEAHDFNIRFLATGGVGKDSTTPGNPSLIIVYTPLQDYPQEYYTQGVKIITFEGRRQFPKAKTTNYTMGIVALEKAKSENAIEVVYVDEEGKLYEGATANFYAVMNGTLYTAEENILEGITRKTILELASQLQIPTKIEFVNKSQIKDFDEVFISAANKEIMPVVTIDDQPIGTGSVGEVTQKIMNAFHKRTRE